MKRKWIPAIGVVMAIALGLVVQGGTRPSQASASYRANISFGEVLTDREIVSVLNNCNVAPAAAWIWTSGLGGAYRPPPDPGLSPDAFLEGLRSRFAAMAQESASAELVRFRRFLDENSEDAVVGSDALEETARGLLQAHEQTGWARSALKNVHALVFRMEVAGSRTAMDCLRGNPLVKEMHEQIDLNGTPVIPEASTPDAYQNREELTFSSDAIGPRELYRRIQQLVASGGEA